MLQKVVLLCVLATVASVRLGASVSQDEVAKNINEAIDLEWVKKHRPAGPAGLESLELWCPAKDYTYCSLFDDTGYWAGVQLSVDKRFVKSMEFDQAVTWFTNWTTTILDKSAEYYTNTVYFISGEKLKTSKESRLANRKPDRMLQHGNIWMTGFNGELHALSLDARLLGTAKSDFTKQGCQNWLGQHYFYKMSNDTTCSADTLFPWFVIMDTKWIVGVGFIAFMKYEEPDPNLVFEYPDVRALKQMVPNGPECLYDLADKGLVTVHVYVEEPRAIHCKPFFG